MTTHISSNPFRIPPAKNLFHMITSLPEITDSEVVDYVIYCDKYKICKKDILYGLIKYYRVPREDAKIVLKSVYMTYIKKEVS